MVKRMVCILFAAAVLAVSPLRAKAAETGWIRVAMDYGDGIMGGEVVLYQVGTPRGEGYGLAEIYGGGFVRKEDAQSAELAQWLAETAGGQGTSRILDADGAADFSGLEEGLYLLVQTEAPEGYYCAYPFLIQMPYAGEWTVQANPKIRQILTESPQTGDHSMPLLSAMALVLSGTGLYFCAEKIFKK